MTTATHDGTTTASPSVTVGQVADWLRLFIEPQQVTELRALRVKQRYGRPQTISGFFDHEHLAEMAQHAVRLQDDAKGIYFVFNPVTPALLSRRCNRVDVAEEGDATADHEVIGRRWLLIDADPKRPAKISATETEKALACEVITKVRSHLDSLGWSRPILADSGNGYHLLYRIDLPSDDGQTVQRCLESLAVRFDTAAVKIDKSVFNPSRITKLYGTLTGKGDDTPDRPHRRSRILEVL